MPKLDTFDITIKTGERGMNATPRFLINGFELEFEQHEGGTGPGETFRATGQPESFPHTLHLTGPPEGRWDIAEMDVTYYPSGEEPYTVRFGSVEVDDESDVNIYHSRPERVFEV
jgi:hypothetical protein